MKQTKFVEESRFSWLFNRKVRRQEKKGWRVESINVTPYFMSALMYKYPDVKSDEEIVQKLSELEDLQFLDSTTEREYELLATQRRQLWLLQLDFKEMDSFERGERVNNIFNNLVKSHKETEFAETRENIQARGEILRWLVE